MIFLFEPLLFRLKFIKTLLMVGGLIEGPFVGYIPHFIARNVTRRNEWVRSKDLKEGLEKIM
jgi:hypothetical protein